MSEGGNVEDGALSATPGPRLTGVLAANAMIAFLILCPALVVTLGPHLSPHPATWLVVIQAAFGFVAASVGAFAKGRQKPYHVLSSLLVTLLIFPSFYALLNFHGDDGPGMAWGLIVVAPCLLASVLGLVLFIVGLLKKA